jgi:hypothetical protein
LEEPDEVEGEELDLAPPELPLVLDPELPPDVVEEPTEDAAPVVPEPAFEEPPPEVPGELDELEEALESDDMLSSVAASSLGGGTPSIRLP